MKPDIIDMIADLVFRTAPDLASRLEYQEEALREAECTTPAVGRWINNNDVKYVLSAFALEDKDFAAKFPAMAKITGAQRQQFIATLETHFDECPHCSLKRGYDLELDARIKQVCQQNSDVLLQLLEEEDESDSKEADHWLKKLKPALSSSQ